MPGDAKRVPVVFYRTGTGVEPVRDWLRGLPIADRQAIGKDIKTVEFGWPIGMPICRPLSKGLWEVRSSLPSGRIPRVLLCLKDGEMYLLHGFIKKTQRTPQDELGLARQRQQEIAP